MKQKFPGYLKQSFSHSKTSLCFCVTGLILLMVSIVSAGFLIPNSTHSARALTSVTSSAENNTEVQYAADKQLLPLASGASSAEDKANDSTSVIVKKIWTTDAVYSLMGETAFFPSVEGKYIDVVAEVKNDTSNAVDISKLISASITKHGDETAQSPDFFAVETANGEAATKSAVVPKQSTVRVHIVFPVSGEKERYTINLTSDRYRYKAAYRTEDIIGNFLPLGIGDIITARKTCLKIAENGEPEIIDATIKLKNAYTTSELGWLDDEIEEELQLDEKTQEAFVMEFDVTNTSDFLLPYSAVANMLVVSDHADSQDIFLNTIVVDEKDENKNEHSTSGNDEEIEKTLKSGERGKVFCISIRPKNAKRNRIYIGIDSSEYFFPSVSSVSIANDAETLFIGEQFEVNVKTNPSNVKLTYVSEDENIASVENNIVTAIKEGETTVKASFLYNGRERSGFVGVTVLSPNIDIAEDKVDLYIDDTEELSVTTFPEGQMFTLKSSNPSVATVDPNGVVEALSQGETIITATLIYAGFEYTDSCIVSVTSPSITLNKHHIEKYFGETDTLFATTVPSNMTVFFESAASDKASVDQSGKILATGAGNTVITASFTYKNHLYSDTCNFSSSIPSITTESSKMIYIGDTFNVNASTTPANQTITYSSSNTTIATVNSSGVVTGKAAGTVEIKSSFEYAGYTYSALCNVTVISPSVTSETAKSMYIGDTFNVNAITVPIDQTVSYSSSDPAVATVNSNGTVTGKAVGTTNITSKLIYAGYSYTAVCRVTVVSPSITVEQQKTILIGDTFDLNTFTLPSFVPVSYSSGSTSIATVSSTGIVTGVSVGATSITAEMLYNGIRYSAVCSVTVGSPNVTITHNLTMYIGDNINLSVSTYPSSLPVTYSVSGDNPDCITVSTNGKVSAIKVGTAFITGSINYKGNTYTDRCFVTVKTPTISVRGDTTIYIGDTLNLNAVTAPANQTVTYSSTDTTIATVNSNGIVTGKAAGTVKMTASFVYAGYTYSALCNVTVISPSVTSETTKSMYIGDTFNVNAVTVPTNQTVSYTSSDPAVATVNSNGTVTGKAAGTTNITSKLVYAGYSYTAVCRVTVVSPSITVEQQKIILIGDTFNLNTSTIPSLVPVSYSSGSTSVATVSSTGIVTGVSAGTTSITAEMLYNGIRYSAVCSVTVGSPNVTITHNLTMYIGDNKNLSVSTYPSSLPVTYSVFGDNPSCIAVSSSGKVTAAKAGTAIIIGTMNYKGHTYTDRCTVNVKTPSISVPDPLTMYIGDAKSFSVSTDPEGQPITIEVANTSVAKVTNGTITAYAQGQTSITASFTYNGIKYSKSTTVTVLTPYIEISGGSTGGATTSLTATTVPSNQTVTWSSSNSSVVSVDGSGNITANDDGTATITAKFTYSGKTYSTSKQVTIGFSEWEFIDYSFGESTDLQYTNSYVAYRYYAYICNNCGHHNPYLTQYDPCENCGSSSLVWSERWPTVRYQDSGSWEYSHRNNDGTIDKNKRATNNVDSGTWFFSAGNLYDTAVGTKDANLSSYHAEVIREIHERMVRHYIISSIS